jgi:hypothetical protein
VSLFVVQRDRKLARFARERERAFAIASAGEREGKVVQRV